MRRAVFGGGALQLAACGALLGAAARSRSGLPWQAALVAGLALALSSTAIAMQTMTERNLSARRSAARRSPILLFQDIAAIPLIALVPLLADGDGAEPASRGWSASRKVARRDRRAWSSSGAS